MKKTASIGFATTVAEALPDKRLIKLSQEQIQSFKTASQVALAVVAAAGIIAVAAVAPNVFQAFNMFLPKREKYRKLSHKEKIRKVAETFYYLKRSGLVSFKKSGRDWLLSLTDLGKRRLPKLEVDAVRVPKQKKWDGKWWLVAADIPTKDYRFGADLLRAKLKQMGFYSLQRTLWLYPFDPRKEVEFVANTFSVGRFVTVMKVEQMDRQDEYVLRRYFKRLNLF